MTPLRKPVTRLTEITIRDGSKRRRLVATLAPGDILLLRPSGTRRQETVDLEACYALAVRQRVNAERMDKARAKKARHGIK